MIKNLIARGIGFTPGSISYIPTHGFSIGEVIDSWKTKASVTSTWREKSDKVDTFKPITNITVGDWI